MGHCWITIDEAQKIPPPPCTPPVPVEQARMVQRSMIAPLAFGAIVIAPPRWPAKLVSKRDSTTRTGGPPPIWRAPPVMFARFPRKMQLRTVKDVFDPQKSPPPANVESPPVIVKPSKTTEGPTLSAPTTVVPPGGRWITVSYERGAWVWKSGLKPPRTLIPSRRTKVSTYGEPV